MKYSLDLSEDTKQFFAQLITNQLFDKLDTINQRLHRIECTQKELKELIMATKEELNAALDNVTAKVNKIGSDLSAELKRLGDLVAAGSDVTESLAKVQSIADQLEAVDATIPEQGV